MKFRYFIFIRKILGLFTRYRKLISKFMIRNFGQFSEIVHLETFGKLRSDEAR